MDTEKCLHPIVLPDIKLENMPNDSPLRVFIPAGKTEPILGELKTLSASPNDYLVRADGKTGVQIRADKIGTEYLGKAWQVQLGMVPRGEWTAHWNQN